MISLYNLPNTVRVIAIILAYVAVGMQVTNILMINIQIQKTRPLIRNLIAILLLIGPIISIYMLGTVSDSIGAGVIANSIPGLEVPQDRVYWVSRVYILINLVLVSVIIVYFFINLRRTMNTITRLSIKEAMDRIPIGNIFCDPDDRVIFQNLFMLQAMKDADLSSHQFGLDLWQEIQQRSISEGKYFRFKKELFNPWQVKEICILRNLQGRSWEFIRADVIIGKKRYTHISAIDVTQEDQLNIALDKQYVELKKMNREIAQISKTLEETQREQTILELKNRIHDIMGQRLSIIHQILEENRHINLSMKEFKRLLGSMLKDLKDKGAEDPARVFENIKSSCNIIKVNLCMEGQFIGTPMQQETMLKIIREAVTNSIRHGKAKNIRVQIYECGEDLIMEIQNDGLTQEGKVAERDGIRGMRRRAKELGGAIHVMTHPVFTVKLVLPK